MLFQSRSQAPSLSGLARFRNALYGPRHLPATWKPSVTVQGQRMPRVPTSRASLTRTTTRVDPSSLTAIFPFHEVVLFYAIGRVVAWCMYVCLFFMCVGVSSLTHLHRHPSIVARIGGWPHVPPFLFGTQ